MSRMPSSEALRLPFAPGERTIIVTGARGYIGCALATRLAAEGHALRLVTGEAAETGSAVAAGEPVAWVTADLRQEAAWRALLAEAGAIVHLSARTDLRAAEQDPAGDEDLNVSPLRALVRALADGRAANPKPAVVFSSAVTIVGVNHANPVNERTPDNPVSVYDSHKLSCERLLAEATADGLLQACSLRLPNVYGSARTSVNVNRGILNAMIRRAVDGEPITIYGDGHYIRDFIHLDDVVQAICRALACVSVQDGRHYVIASGQGRSLADIFAIVAREAYRATGVAPEMRHVPEPPDLLAIERRNFVGDSGLFQRMTGWQPTVALEDGIQRTIKEMMPTRGVTPVQHVTGMKQGITV